MAYFYIMASNRSRTNLIMPAMVGLGNNASVEELKIVVTNVFKGRFSLNRGIHVEGWDVQFPCLDWVEAYQLETPLSEEEIQRELMGASGNKAPSLDGFTFKFA